MAVKYVLDTSAFSAFNRGDARLQSWINVQHEIIVPLVVVGELRAGFAAGARQQVNESLLRRFLDTAHVSVVTISDATTVFYADIFAALRRKGRPINVNDMWIAALALEHNCPVLTLDSDFAHVPALELIRF